LNLSREAEADLVAQAAEGGEDAFRRLHDAYEKPVYGFIRVRSDSDDDASEIAQEVWLKFWKSAKNFDSSRASCLTFLRAIASSALADYYRRAPKPGPILFSDLLRESGELDQDIEIGDLLARLTPRSVHALPDAMKRIAEDLLLRVTFGGPSPPHQLITFGFCERLGWKPQAIVDELAATQLVSLERRLEDEYVATSEVSEQTVRSRFQQLRAKMHSRLEDVLTEAKVRDIYHALLNDLVGNTLLRQYFTRDASQEISHWCHTVRRRALAQVMTSRRDSGKAAARSPACEINPPSS